ncbi:MAG: hypothetical protein EU536_01600 [Promethearchaeota archaeon]|nr:MAG: hypothetical protein EU536_01600 [Candidatus Lokiarchaeota archaeon]
MISDDIELYNVKDDGELEQLTITGPINTILTSEMVVLLSIESQKMIYLWKGTNAKVRRKFIGARVSQDLRGQKGLNFKVDSIDQGDEPSAFINLVGGPIAGGSAPTEAPPSGAAAAPTMQAQQVQAAPTFQTAPQIQQTSSFQTAPTIQAAPTIQSQPTVIPAPTVIQPVGGLQIKVPDQVEEGVKAIIYEIEKRPPPAPYQRELVFIGPYAFSIAETKRGAFGQEQIEHNWELASPPEGQFIAEEYTPRAIVQAGKVLAIEFMRGGGAIGTSTNAEIPIFKIKYQK